MSVPVKTSGLENSLMQLCVLADGNPGISTYRILDTSIVVFFT